MNMIPVTRSILTFHDYGEHHRLIDTTFIVEVPCPCCNQRIEDQKYQDNL